MITNFVLAFFFGWIMVITFIVYKLRNHYNQLTSRTRRRSIDEILDAVLKQGKSNETNQQELKKELDKVQSHLKHSYQKMGLVRFDAFGKSEGEQSFVLALLNENNDGVILNFIYIHDGVRIYAKQIKGGKGEKHELSEEEKQAVGKAG
ncbi:hypothetical protein A2334_04810 [Candidatus Roizmanbacteria bacterium RIFOXYB2_FULL_38_10]|uniref:DUF4446 domain-containing protein n=1 Tax=Candidatus Roizmanbacteria bacterium RIFOXYD1_FULL_38_12 TaxID=1802093 RepID=A0A1F7KZN4_9BACT|nr:MAG: hypothetical protein A3K47_00910 [Candidatus Roizmanbacteria bacterium RIFOXYA2_FULL_38_14]OGK63346.1 MAG: hypothetical protein A3K27_00910 [Candidatus Roizmanbacteria bacterium RIFOXYA1_FULL_37_12]OGK65192.1 MAG: hypothetical protein A3K38_00910 [Candidatus Roizmanbacteria bacterium RIFOXYB1_FULL_40_23]OGK68746.1 MAG: hypothetical protein A2334_04810 [Candidatus Roizmanbacteria bacterium RIFOXYB2_FULL_38_10]OGK69597.1 MAG: hypothetical protein A3K21_00915 [Candidatus Roizmanbacteria ba